MVATVVTLFVIGKSSRPVERFLPEPSFDSWALAGEQRGERRKEPKKEQGHPIRVPLSKKLSAAPVMSVPRFKKV
jgi:hypothetical protein